MSLDYIHPWKELNKDFPLPLRLTIETTGGQAVPRKQRAAGCKLPAPRMAPAHPGGQPTTPALCCLWDALAGFSHARGKAGSWGGQAKDKTVASSFSQDLILKPPSYRVSCGAFSLHKEYRFGCEAAHWSLVLLCLAI